MSDENSTATQTRQSGAKFSSREWSIICLVGCVALTALVAWAAYQFQQRGMAPLVIFPLLVGAAIGAGQLGLSRVAGFAYSRAQLAAAVVWGLLAVFGQDYIGYREDLARHAEQIVARQKAVDAGLVKPDDPRLNPPSLGTSIARRIELQPVMWSLDLVLTVTGAAAVVWFNGRPRKDAELAAKL